MAFDKRRTKWLLSTLVASATYSIFISYDYSWVGNLPSYIAILLSLSVVPIASLMLLWEAADFLAERSRIYVSVLLAIAVLAFLFVSTLDRPENYFWLIIAWLAAVVLMWEWLLSGLYGRMIPRMTFAFAALIATWMTVFLTDVHSPMIFVGWTIPVVLLWEAALQGYQPSDGLRAKSQDRKTWIEISISATILMPVFFVLFPLFSNMTTWT
jgi:hypothetical protein